MKRYLSVLAENRPGTLMKISGLLCRRGFEVENLSFGQDTSEGFSRLNIAVTTEMAKSDQVVNQLEKLVEVIEVRDIGNNALIDRWILMIKVSETVEDGPYISLIADLFNAEIVERDGGTITFEVAGDSVEIEACLEAFKPFGIIESTSFNTVAKAREELKCKRDGSLYKLHEKRSA